MVAPGVRDERGAEGSRGVDGTAVDRDEENVTTVIAIPIASGPSALMCNVLFDRCGSTVAYTTVRRKKVPMTSAMNASFAVVWGPRSES